MMKKTTILMVLLAIIVIMAFVGCIQSKSSVTGKDNGNVSIIKGHDLKISEFETTQGLKKFSSAKEMRDFLKANTAQMSGGVIYGAAPPAMAVPGVTPAVQTGASETVSAPPEVPGIVDYSKTNIQVEGVDEADFIKNDGKYIYALALNKVVIVDAFPAADARILSEITIDGKPRDILVNDNRLVVFTEDNKESLYFPQYDYRPAIRYFKETTALIYDITDRKKPELLANYSINGNYFRSRMIGDYIYFIVKDELYYYSDVLEMPSINQGSVKVLSPDVYYFDNPEVNYVLHTIASINLKSNGINAKFFMMGYSDNLYVSENNIYLTYRKNPPAGYDEMEREERFYKVIVPKLPEDAQDKINAVKDSRLESYEKGAKISSIMEETYNRMSHKEKIDFISNAENAYIDYEYKLTSEMEKTVIQKIRIYKGDIEYVTKGEVSGSLLNQFSMDEAGDYFRIATTSQLLTRRSSVPYNNVYVMDKDLTVVGKLENIAQEEKIYSTRFIGNRLYMVTFKRIDPLFVIDLSNPKEPKILGKLKIPGFSDYLHPYDESHIIGVGKETADNEWGGVSTKGVKLSLFDVSDVENPRQLSMYEIGKAGTDSEALLDHKAFLFDKKKNLLVVPISEIMEKGQYNSKYGHNMQRVWQGAYVFAISPEDGFRLRGNISHFDDHEEPEYYWNSPSAVRRSMYMDGVLYTVSAPKILMNSLDNLTKINSIDLPFDKGYFQEYRWR